MSDNNVIQAFARPGEIPDNPIQLTTSGKPYNMCHHELIDLDEHRRTVNCRQCGADIDAFTFLHKNARTLQMAWGRHKSVSHELGELITRVDLLKKEEARLKARVKRAKDNTPAPLDIRGREL